MRIGIMEGSLRKASLSRAFGRAATSLAPDGVEMVHLPSTGTLPLYSQDVQDAGMPESVTAFADAAAAVDAFLFVTPEYNWSIPGSLKNAIDWLSRFNPHPLDGKPAAIWTASPGLLGGARVHEPMRHILHSQGMHIMAKPEVQIGGAKGKIDVDSDAITNEDTATFLSEHLKTYAGFCQRVIG